MTTWLGPMTATALVALVALALALYRSPTIQARLRYRRMARLAPHELPAYLNRTMARLTTPQGHAVLERLGRQMAEAGDDPRADLAEIVNATAPLLGLLAARGGRVDPEIRREIATVLDARVEALERLQAQSPRAASQEDHLHDPAGPVALQDRIFAGLLRAESPVHLAALRDELETVTSILKKTPRGPFVHLHFLDDLRRILDALAPLQRLPGAEDQALLLSQALNRVLEIQEQLVILTAEQPTFGLVVGNVVLESLRQTLASALRDLSLRASLVLELASRVLTTRREAVVVLELHNRGRGYARDITVVLEPESEAQLRVAHPRRHLKGLERRQSARLEFLVEPETFSPVRLRFLVDYSDPDQPGRRIEFADRVEFRRIARPPRFEPLHPNPFVVGRPLLESDVFIGREALFERLRTSFLGSAQQRFVVLVGQRRVGKTSILRRIHRELPTDFMPVLVDLQGHYCRGEPAFFRELAATISDSLRSQGLPVEAPPPERFEIDPGQIFRQEFLESARRALDRRRLLLLVDEFEVLEERIQAGDLEPRILPYFRSLLQDEAGVSFLFAGTHRLEELSGDPWRTLLDLAIHLEVGHLTRDEVETLVTQPTRQHFELDPLALAKIHHLTDGHPHFSQLLARETVELRNRQRLAYLTIQDINTVADLVTRRGQLHFRYFWDEASEDERLALLVLCELLDREGVASVASAHRYLVDHRIEPVGLPAATRRLVRRGILEEHGGQLAFAMELLRRWMACHLDLQTFLLASASRRPSTPRTRPS